MSTTYTASIGLHKPALNDRNWHEPLLATIDALDSLAPIGGLCVTLTEVPSTTLNVKASAGSFRKSDGTIVSYAGTASQALTASATNYLYLTDSGTLTVNTTGFPAATWHVRLATAVCDGTTVTGIADGRLSAVSSGHNGSSVYLALAGGTLDDGANVAVGSTTGTKIGTATTQKLAFFNSTPIVQPANTVEIVAGLVSLGLRAAGGNPSLALGTGAIGCGTITLTDAANIVANTTTGTKIGTAVGQKFSFWNATPIVQPASANQAAVGTLATTGLTDSTGGTADGTLSAVSGSGDDTNINNNFKELREKLANTVTDLTTLKTLVNQLRTDLVSAGLIKGSA